MMRDIIEWIKRLFGSDIDSRRPSGRRDVELIVTVPREKALYEELCNEKYKERPFETRDLDEGMSMVDELIGGYWKPRYIVDHNAGCAYEFMSRNEYLETITEDDIDLDSLVGIPEEAREVAESLWFHYPSFIRRYEEGVAEVSWQLNPDGRYYMDDDGYGMTNDREVTIYGYVDRKGKVLVPFRAIKDFKELKPMREEARRIVAERGGV